MDWTQITTSVLSAVSAIIVAYMTFVAKKDNDKNHQTSMKTSVDILKQLNHLDKRLGANDLKTSRIDLRTALTHSRDDIPAMLELAQDYFVVNHGNADLGPKFLYWVKEYKVEQWAAEHNEDISEIIECAKHRR